MNEKNFNKLETKNGKTFYTIKKNDTLSEIVSYHLPQNTSIKELNATILNISKINNLKDPSKIEIGMLLDLSSLKPATELMTLTTGVNNYFNIDSNINTMLIPSTFIIVVILSLILIGKRKNIKKENIHNLNYLINRFNKNRNILKKEDIQKYKYYKLEDEKNLNQKKIRELNAELSQIIRTSENNKKEISKIAEEINSVWIKVIDIYSNYKSKNYDELIKEFKLDKNNIENNKNLLRVVNNSLEDNNKFKELKNMMNRVITTLNNYKKILNKELLFDLENLEKIDLNKSKEGYTKNYIQVKKDIAEMQLKANIFINNSTENKKTITNYSNEINNIWIEVLKLGAYNLKNYDELRREYKIKENDIEGHKNLLSRVKNTLNNEKRKQELLSKCFDKIKTKGNEITKLKPDHFSDEKMIEFINNNLKDRNSITECNILLTKLNNLFISIQKEIELERRKTMPKSDNFIKSKAEIIGERAENIFINGVSTKLTSENGVLLNNLLISIENGMIELETSQIDHVIVSESGIYVIETKGKEGGYITGSAHNKKWDQKKHKTVSYDDKKKKLIKGEVTSHLKIDNPFDQNYGHIKVLQELFNDEYKIKLPFFNIVFISGASEVNIEKKNIPRNGMNKNNDNWFEQILIDDSVGDGISKLVKTITNNNKNSKYRCDVNKIIKYLEKYTFENTEKNNKKHIRDIEEMIKNK